MKRQSFILKQKNKQTKNTVLLFSRFCLQKKRNQLGLKCNQQKENPQLDPLTISDLLLVVKFMTQMCQIKNNLGEVWSCQSK